MAYTCGSGGLPLTSSSALARGPARTRMHPREDDWVRRPTALVRGVVSFGCSIGRAGAPRHGLARDEEPE